MLGGRGRTFGTLSAIAVGMVALGLLLPYLVGDDVAELAASPDAISVGDDEPAAAEDVTGLDETVGPSSPGEESTSPVATQRPGSSSSPTTAGPGSVVRRASDTGVTADHIKAAFLLLDVGGLDQIGFAVGVTVEQQQAALQAFVDELNEAGGVHGRKIEPVYRPVNLLDEDAGRVACLQATQDDKVFVSAGHLPRPEDVQCFTQQQRSSLVTTNQYADESYAAAEGRLVTLQMRGFRLMQHWVQMLDQVKYLDGRKVGILSDEGNDRGGLVAAVLKQRLEAAGHPVVRVARLPRDLQTGSGQIPVEVNQMRSAGAEAMFFVSNSLFAQQFVQQAQGQGWRPRYSTSPWASLEVDTSNENMPESFDGSIGVAAVYPGFAGPPVDSWPQPERGKQCEEIYERRSGRQLAERGTNEHGLTMLFCDVFHLLVSGLQRAGDNPTRASLAAGFTQVGSIEGQAWMPGGSLRPGKLDGGDYLRPQRWKYDCTCWQPAGPYQRFAD